MKTEMTDGQKCRAQGKDVDRTGILDTDGDQHEQGQTCERDRDSAGGQVAEIGYAHDEDPIVGPKFAADHRSDGAGSTYGKRALALVGIPPALRMNRRSSPSRAT